MVVPDPAHPVPPLRIALAHDWLVGMRGGERVLEAIAIALAPHHSITSLYTMFDDHRPLSPHLDALPKHTSPIGRLPAAPRLRRWLLPLYPAAVAALSRRLARDHAREPIDLLISTSSAAVKGLRAPPGVPHLCYCHTPARYLWSQAEQYAGGLRGLGLRLLRAPLQNWDGRTASHVTRFLANSTHTQIEITRCYNRPSEILFPPVRTDYFTPADAPAADAFWLAVGALESYKRFDAAIEAACIAGARLLIVGTGSDEPRLRRLAAPHVTFLGRVGDDRLRDLYRAARLLIFPQVEDFGIVAVEAQACGCPILARAAGGALDTVIDGKTGAHFHWKPAHDSVAPHLASDERLLLDALARVPQRCEATTAACRRNAERFSREAFAAGLLRAVAGAVARG